MIIISYTLLTCINVLFGHEINEKKKDVIQTNASNYHFTTPQLTDENGNFLSHHVSYYKSLAIRQKREDNFKTKFQTNIYYKITYKDKVFSLNLTSNLNYIVAKSFSLEIWNKSTIVERRNVTSACYYTGTVGNHTFSRVVLNNCFGLQGILTIEDSEYLIEPLLNQSVGHTHVVYKRDIVQHPSNYHKKKKRSTNIERYLETLIVADKAMVNYHGLRQVEPYILTVMNIVHHLYREASVGHSINIVVTRIILLIEDQPDLQITHHASMTLHNFCIWQKNVNSFALDTNMQEIAHHDNAILLTRYDICYNKDEPCDTLGLAHIAGICQPDKSCSINQDIGLVSAYTIAHELGHNFGMQHDGVGNKCKRMSSGDKGFLMSKKLSYITHPVRWSSCSRNYLTEFIDSGHAECMNNAPDHDGLFTRPMLPENLDADHQCKFQFGSFSKPCWNKTNVCQKLWCKNRKGQCVTANIPMLNGTPCTSNRITNGWCFKGHCVDYGSKPTKVDGQWSKWSKWDECSTSCGGGIAKRERFCSNPEPENGGKFCYGERKQYKSCNVGRCRENSADFRAVQCSAHDDRLFRGHYYQWIPYYEDHMNPCTLYCQAAGYNFFEKKAAKVVDGTRCFPRSLDVCVNGHCQPVGCDLKLYSKATEDHCGVCNGNGSTCIIKSGTMIFNGSLNHLVDVVIIPKGAMHIIIKESEKSKNILGIKLGNVTSDEWMALEANFVIAGTVFDLISSENESKSFYAFGPTKQHITLTVLVKEVNKGVYYQFNIENKCDKCKMVNEECQDVNKANYCQMALKLNFCNRNYFKKLCCKTCSKNVNKTNK